MMFKNLNDTFNKLIIQEKEAREFGFAWPNYDMIFDQIKSECDEVNEALSNGETDQRVQEEIGDLLHAVITLYVFLDIDIEDTAEKALMKYASRLASLKALTKQRGLETLKGQDIGFKRALWSEAKQ